MEKETRNAIERATQKARWLMEEDFAAQLESTFDVLLTGTAAPAAGVHLTPREAKQRERIVAAIEHKRAAGIKAAEAVADYVRDAAFTTLNRFAALKMLEARGLVQECVSKGEQSSGYREFCGLAPGVALLPAGAGYRLYVESLFDELSTEIKVLFDRRDPASVLWPRRATFADLLDAFNAPDLAGVWTDDETIGWVYQYFNSGEERRKMREASQAPRNSRELAVRNQFFTPRYVVEFLVDNTLGRTWLEMHGRDSRLAGQCRYFVRTEDDQVTARLRKDPRDLRVLDPACGSGHFLLYAFDLLLTIYEEAWAAEAIPRSDATGRTLRDDYAAMEAVRRAAPALIVEHNLHGVDIDPRAAQIAALALWLRAQRAWKDLGVPAAERPRISRTHIVVAEPMPGDQALVEEFAARLNPPLLRDLFRTMVTEMRLAGEIGTLLPLELSLAAEVSRARQQFVTQRYTPQAGVLPGMERGPAPGELDLSGIDDDRFFHEVETRLLEALREFAEGAAGGASVRRRLFAGDASQGIALIDLLRRRFDVVLMNPPFGEASESGEALLSRLWPSWNANLVCAFIARSAGFCLSGGLIGTVADRTVANKSTYERFRRCQLMGGPFLSLFADLGWGVLDANVEVAALVLTSGAAPQDVTFIDVRDAGETRANSLRGACPSCCDRRYRHALSRFAAFPSHALVYDLPSALLSSFGAVPSLGQRGFLAYTGHQLQASRHFQHGWEQSDGRDVGPFTRLYNGGAFSRFLLPHSEIVRFGYFGQLDPADVTNYTFVLRNSAFQFVGGVGFGVRGEWLDAHFLEAGFLFTVEGQVIPVESEADRYFLTGFLNSTVASRLLNTFCGQHKYSGYVKQLPCPDPRSAEAQQVAALSREACLLKARWFALDETCDWYVGPCLGPLKGSLGDYAKVLRQAAEADSARLNEILAEIDELVLKGLSAHDTDCVRDIAASRSRAPCERVAPSRSASDEEFSTTLAAQLVSALVGVCFGRWSVAQAQSHERVLGRTSVEIVTHLWRRPAFKTNSGAAVYVDDPAHPRDLVDTVQRTLSAVFDNGHELEMEICATLQLDLLRDYFRSSKGFFASHLKTYSDGRRVAPIYWQLATPSASYSVWLYAHRVTRDTFFQLQNDIVGPKLLHEEQRLAGLIERAGATPSAAARKEIAAQESLVDEIRTMLDEIRRVAPLWNPDLDDGIVLVITPLWRLVPQHMTWQRELKSRWDELVAGKYDWAHLAMHLWPERIVPQCATDRSLAIAHGLEDEFWVVGADGKWKPRPAPTRPIEEMVRERSSTAVKAALKSLLEAPAPGNSAKRVRTGRRGARA